ncbi:zona pellucida sperm-binding protein 3-like [Thamnophis elegans]|uniref:zona pellucida sperm-binding protein 3-like n=1 Tax=Thamnophis elegans TaxID=35005 RepID=UPI001376E38B|nr:zona pellucida sperm-binding protein 3-like [Thamnophis elegans]
MVVTVRRDLFGMGKLVDPMELALGPAACPPLSLGAGGVVVFEAGLHECGSVVQMTPNFLIYQTQLSYRPSLTNHPVIARSRGTTIGLECRYPRKENVTRKALHPTWLPFQSTAMREAKLGFSLRLMNDDWMAERVSGRFLLGEPLRLQADVQAENHLPLRLWVDSCRASMSPMPASGPQYEIMGASGCLLDGRQEGVSSAFLAPRLRQETLRFTVDAFRFTGEAQKPSRESRVDARPITTSSLCPDGASFALAHTDFIQIQPKDGRIIGPQQGSLAGRGEFWELNHIYITCRLKVTPGDVAPDVLNKACSFDAASRS